MYWVPDAAPVCQPTSKILTTPLSCEPSGLRITSSTIEGDSEALATGTWLTTLMPLRSTTADVILRIELCNLISVTPDRPTKPIGTNGHFL
jgi:hypothetical protein